MHKMLLGKVWVTLAFGSLALRLCGEASPLGQIFLVCIKPAVYISFLNTWHLCLKNPGMARIEEPMISE